MVSDSIRLQRRYEITCIYRRPRALLGHAKEVISGIRHRRNSIVMGDLNAKHTSLVNCITDNELGKYIFQQPVIVINPGVHTFRHTGALGSPSD